MNDMLYWAVVAWGGLALLIEAFRNYRLQTGRHPFHYHPILKDVAIRDLATPGEFFAGYCFYGFLYLLVYAICFGSAQVATLLQEAAIARTGVGAIGDLITPERDPLSLGSTAYAQPIIVSTALISLLSVEAVRPFELFLRGLAHRLAGIPHGIYRTIQSLNEILKTDKTLFHDDGSLAKKFSDLKFEQLDDAKKNDIKRQMNLVDGLRVAVDAAHGLYYFPLFDHDGVTKLRQKQLQCREAVESTLEEIRNLSEKADSKRCTGDDKKKLRDLKQNLDVQVTAASSATVALFAVMFARNNKAVRDFAVGGSGSDPIIKIGRTLQEKFNAAQNAFGLSIFLSSIGSFVITTALYFGWFRMQAKLNTASYQKFSEQNCSTPEPYHAAAKNQLAQACDKLYYAWNDPHIAPTATWDTIETGAVTLLAVLFALIVREGRVEQQSWNEKWTIRQFPFLRLFWMSTLSGAIAVLASTATGLLEAYVESSFSLTSAAVTDYFTAQYPYLLLSFGSGLILSFAALIMMDKHEAMAFWQTLLWAIAAAVVYLLYTWVRVWLGYGAGLPGFCTESGTFCKEGWFSPDMRDVLILSILPMLFCVLFAVTLEWSEPEPKPKPKPEPEQQPRSCCWFKFLCRRPNGKTQ